MPMFRLRAHCFVFTLLLSASDATAGQLFEVAIPKVDVAAGERIVAFEIMFQSARIHSLREVLNDWYITIDNRGPVFRRVTGAVQHGAGAVNPDFLDRLVAVEIFEDDALNFSIEMKIHATADFATTREIILRTEDISLVAQ